MIQSVNGSNGQTVSKVPRPIMKFDHGKEQFTIPSELTEV